VGGGREEEILVHMAISINSLGACTRVPPSLSLSLSLSLPPRRESDSLSVAPSLSLSLFFSQYGSLLVSPVSVCRVIAR